MNSALSGVDVHSDNNMKCPLSSSSFPRTHLFAGSFPLLPVCAFFPSALLSGIGLCATDETINPVVFLHEELHRSQTEFGNDE